MEGTAFDGHVGGKAKLDHIVVRFIVDENATLAAVLAGGQLDYTERNTLRTDHLLTLKQQWEPSGKGTTVAALSTAVFLFMQQRPEFVGDKGLLDLRVRQALAYAIDADAIVKGVMDGKAVRVATMLTSLHFGYDASLKPITQDLARSKKLLAEAGFPNGVEIVLNGPQGRYVRDREVGEAVAGQLNKAGIKTTLKTYEFVSYLNNMVYVHKAGPVWLIGWGHPTMDAEAIYVPLFKSPGIFVNWQNDDFNHMVDEAQTIMDEKKRLAQYHKINKLWIDEMPAVPLYQQIDLYGANKRIAWKARSDELIRAYDMSIR
jgi:peptide/nickel transport system substrate-binding protein